MNMYGRQEPWVETVEGNSDTLICSCGLSKTTSHCDGQSDPDGCKPYKHHAKRQEILLICGCGRSKAMPFCDGSHNRQPENTAWKLFLDFLRNPFK